MMNQHNPSNRFDVVDLQTATAMSGLDFLRRLQQTELPAPPFAEVTDIWLVEVEAGRVVFEGQPSRRFYNPLGTVHGGWISTLLDSAMGCAVHSRLQPGQAYTTVEMKVNFVRPLFEHSGLLRCEAFIVHFGRRIATSEGKVVDSKGNIIAHGSETCMVLETPGQPGVRG
jgi:uncharacterized protein (TIGR00369 family)